MPSPSQLNQQLFRYAEHPRAVPIFALLSFCSASFLPFMLDPLFVLLVLRRQNPWPLVLLGTIGLCLGGLVMYIIGYGTYQTVGTWLINTYGWQSKFDFLSQQLQSWGGVLLIVKSFTPVPYKLMALVSGFGHLNLMTFVVGSFVGRFLRLGGEVLALKLLGPRFRLLIERYFAVFFGLSIVMCVGLVVLLLWWL